jgi:mono/diheme cytochrome c family protein
MYTRLAVVIVLGAALGCAVSPACARDVERGRLLYETFCVSCHDRSVHARKQRVAKSYSQVKAQVERWQGNIGLTWDKTEIEDVAAYLNSTVYQFE